MRRRWLRSLLRYVVSGALLLTLLFFLDASEITSRITKLDLRWVALGLIICVLQIMLLAWRWRFTAERLGVGMSYRHALSEYYLGVLLNQLLPGGILGDVSRAWRHAVSSARTRTAVHAVILERLMVQTVMVAVAVVSVIALASRWPAGAVWGWWGLGTLLAIAISAIILRLASLRSIIRPLGADARRAFLPSPVLLLQFGTATLVMAANLMLYIAAARALGSDIAVTTLLPLIAPVLLVMMLPISIAGWGVREGAAALLWGFSGLGAAEGVAIAVAYGLLFLLAALPGVVPLLSVTLRSGRGWSAMETKVEQDILAKHEVTTPRS